MILKKLIILICLLSVIEIPLNNLFSQAVQTKPTRQSSFEAFSQRNYEKAYAEFRELLLTYTKDPLYKYYSGVCLVKMGKDPGEATNLLQDALQGNLSVKTLPSDGLFYLGRAQQMSGKFSEATGSYNLYADRAGKKAAKEMGVPDFLEECMQKKGQVTDSGFKQAENLKIIKSDTSNTETKAAKKEPVQKTAENATYNKVNLPSKYEQILSEAIEFQFKADSVTSIVNEQKKKLEILPGSEKAALKDKILENEKKAVSLQKSADQKYHEAQVAMNPNEDSTLRMKEPARQSEYKIVSDTAKKADNKMAKTGDKKPDTTKVVIPSVRSQVEVFAFFDASTLTATDSKAKIVIDADVPPGLIYRIQIAVFRNPVLPGYFKGITPIYGFKIGGTDKTIYYAGMFRKSSDSKKALATVKTKGFKDAFVVALLANKPVSPDRAALLEKEWGGNPFYLIEKIFPDTHADTITPTLTFRVEVMRSLKPLTEDMVEDIRKIAGNRGLDIQLLENGGIDYLIGKFITFETAAEYSDLLQKNGYREAKVVAWLGKKEIPIETAKQLFEKLK
jgi:hypothetical protein